MSENKRTIEKYIDGFSRSDHEQVLSCLADDVEWDIPGAFHITGKAAFDKEIENPAFAGRPSITTSRMTEENDVVVAEGSVRTQRVDGGFLNLRFCDVFVMHDRKIRQLISYLMEVKQLKMPQGGRFTIADRPPYGDFSLLMPNQRFSGGSRAEAATARVRRHGISDETVRHRRSVLQVIDRTLGMPPPGK